MTIHEITRNFTKNNDLRVCLCDFVDRFDQPKPEAAVTQPASLNHYSFDNAFASGL
jgi:hypothetical protein